MLGVGDRVGGVDLGGAIACEQRCQCFVDEFGVPDARIVPAADALAL